MTADATAPLAGVRVIDCSLLSPGATAAHLADLGAEVIKVEAPEGDYVRSLTWPIIAGNSLMHHHVSRGKKSLTLDLRKESGVAVFRDLVCKADVVIEAMRPGALARRGLGYEALRLIRPELVFCAISGYGMTGPYKDAPAHGVAFDSWAGLVKPGVDAEGFCFVPEHPSIGMHAGPLIAALSICAALLRARATGTGAFLELGQSDAAAYMDWLRIETWKAYERPQSEVTGNKTDDYVRRAPGTAGMEKGVRYQYYASADGHVLFMASEQEFWRNFCTGIDRLDLFERWPGKQYRRSRHGQSRAAGDTAQHLRDQDHARMDGVRGAVEYRDRAAEHAANHRSPTRTSRRAFPGCRPVSTWRTCCRSRCISSARNCRGPLPRRARASTTTACCASCWVTARSSSRRCGKAARWVEGGDASPRAPDGMSFRTGFCSGARSAHARTPARRRSTWPPRPRSGLP